MTFIGMGYVEVFVVALVAFVFLGPARMVYAAKKLGKVFGEIRRMAAELPSTDELDLEWSRTEGPESCDSSERDSITTDDVPDEDGPVAFRARDASPKSVQRDKHASQDEV